LLSAKAELCDELAVASDIAIANVIKHAATAAYQHQQSTTRVVVLMVRFEVLRQVIDAVGKKCDLHFR
jgi:hypothetical protein